MTPARFRWIPIVGSKRPVAALERETSGGKHDSIDSPPNSAENGLNGYSGRSTNNVREVFIGEFLWSFVLTAFRFTGYPKQCRFAQSVEALFSTADSPSLQN